MATKSIVDTHSLIWHLEGNPKLGKKAKAVLDSPNSELILPAIALAEAVFTVTKGKTNIPSVTDLISDVTNDPRIEIYPLTFEVLQASLNLNAIPEMHDLLWFFSDAVAPTKHSRAEHLNVLAVPPTVIVLCQMLQSTF